FVPAFREFGCALDCGGEGCDGCGVGTPCHVRHALAEEEACIVLVGLQPYLPNQRFDGACLKWVANRLEPGEKIVEAGVRLIGPCGAAERNDEEDGCRPLPHQQP